MKKSNWRNQFGEEYAIPAEVLGLPGIVDQSWGNDACLSFTLGKWEREGDLAEVVLWVEHPEKGTREMAGARFTVCRQPRHDEAEPKWVDLYCGDDATRALAVLERGAE